MNEKKEQPYQFNDLDIPPELLQNLQKSDHANVSKRIKSLKEFMGIEITDIQQIQLLAGHVGDFKKFLDFKDKHGRNIVFYALWSESINVLEWIFESHKDLIKSCAMFPQPPDLEHGINTVIAECILPTVFLKSIPLLTWLLNVLIVGNEIKEDKIYIHKHLLLEIVSAHKWIEALDIIQAISPDYIQSHGKAIINVGIKGKRPDIFQWATQHLFDQLMTPVFFAKATSYGMLEAVNWFLANAPEDVLNYKSANGTTATHLAASSKSNRVFKAITELKIDSINQCDNNRASIVEYALNSYSSHRVNEALKLCQNPTELHFMRTPKRFVDGWDYTCSSLDRTTHIMTTKKMLAYNFTLQTIHGEYDFIFDEEKDSVQLMMERNKIIAQFEQSKPFIILLLCISRKQEIWLQVPFEIIQGIIKCILPNNVPQTTVNLYRDNFFFNRIQNQSPQYEEDSQEECMIGSDSDEEYYVGFN